jgi:hypothetical protein
MLYDLISETRDNALRLKPELPEIPDEPPSGDTERVYASDLGMCPLKATRDRHGDTPVIPELHYDNQPGGRHRMEVGNLLAHGLIQRPMLWRYGKGRDGILAETEKRLAGENFLVRGRVDLVLRVNDEVHLIEIKTRNVTNPSWEVKISDFFQVRSYARIWEEITGEVPHMHIITLNWDYMNLYTVKPVDRASFVIIDRLGKHFPNPFNTPYKLNDAALDAEVHRHLEYLHRFNDECPIPDPENNDMGWQCIQWCPKPTKNKPGAMKARCHHSCHFSTPGDKVEVEVLNGRREASWEGIKV